MTRLLAICFVLLLPGANFAQESRTPISVSRTGQDLVGSLFETALNTELSRSKRYVSRRPEGGTTRAFYIDLATTDTADNKPEQGKKSVVSIVIQDFGALNTYPVPSMWYHKVIIVDKSSVVTVAKDLLDDMDARWCNTIRNSRGGCPKEKFYPQL
jgi:hypothetical protein